MKRCHSCGTELPVSEKILRTEECPGCGRDLHCCKNCRHHDPAVHNQCREPIAEWVSDKERANFCDYFSFADSPDGAAPESKKSPEGAAREKWNRLFKS